MKQRKLMWCVVIAVVLFVLLYGMFAFVLFIPSPLAWSEASRLCFMMLWVCLVFPLIGMFLTI